MLIERIYLAKEHLNHYQKVSFKVINIIEIIHNLFLFLF